MTYYQQLKQTINTCNELSFRDEKEFFNNQLAEQLKGIHRLMLFNNIKHSGFQEFLELFRNDVRLDIKRCMRVSDEMTTPEKMELHRNIQKRVNAKLKAVEFAFSWQLQDRGFLHSEMPATRIVKPNWANERLSTRLQTSLQ